MIVLTVVSVLCWVGITFVAQPIRNVPDPENENSTISVEVPQLPVGAWYPWDARHGPAFAFSFGFQVHLEFVSGFLSVHFAICFGKRI